MKILMKSNVMKRFMLTSCVLIALACSLNSCVRPQEKLQKQIEGAEMELSLADNAIPSVERSDSLITMYMQYADQYKDDTLSPVYIFKSAELYMKTGRYQMAIDHFGKVQRYKGFRKIGEAMFLKGFIADSQLGDTARARQYYQEFVQAFPGHEFADDAQHLIENLDLTADELIRKLQSSETNDSLLMTNH